QNSLMPVFFIGHGDPMNALRDNAFTRSLAAMGKSSTVKPKAIMVISAHWLTRGTYVATTATPETIYDFGGFPDEMYHIVYPAPGAPDVAKEVMKLSSEVKPDAEWGLDHGAWTVLKHMFPAADIPTFQLSIDYFKPMQYHFDLARALKPLREQGVLVIGSGNIVHNLRAFFSSPQGTPFDWTVEFDKWVKEKIEKRDFQSLINYESEGAAAKLAVPTVDHYVPMLYSLALAGEKEPIAFTYEEVQSSLSMRCFKVG
ncbi:MAG TPA: 4,5-DOPA dioxygenase extradiol, partial [Candidatus Kapabacteria bacterium]|nr:4,5-DOPA dioxygenase extradiol [Candidatus Kapabacteria bacterium]